MKSKNFTEKQIVVEKTYGLSNQLTRKKLITMIIIKFDPSTKKGKAIGQILDGLRRLL